MTHIYVDGQITPEDSMICIIINGRDKIIESKIGVKDVTDIEKIALLSGLKKALLHAGEKHNSFVFSDSVSAVKSYYLDEDYAEIRNEILQSRKKIFVGWQPREVNLAGIELQKRLEILNYSAKSVLGLKKGIREKIFKKKTTKFIKGRFYTKEYDAPKGET